jgi:hypothetical protein
MYVTSYTLQTHVETRAGLPVKCPQLLFDLLKIGIMVDNFSRTPQHQVLFFFRVVSYVYIDK